MLVWNEACRLAEKTEELSAFLEASCTGPISTDLLKQWLGKNTLPEFNIAAFLYQAEFDLHRKIVLNTNWFRHQMNLTIGNACYDTGEGFRLGSPLTGHSKFRHSYDWRLEESSYCLEPNTLGRETNPKKRKEFDEFQNKLATSFAAMKLPFRKVKF